MIRKQVILVLVCEEEQCDSSVCLEPQELLAMPSVEARLSSINPQSLRCQS